MIFPFSKTSKTNMQIHTINMYPLNIIIIKKISHTFVDLGGELVECV